MNCNIKSIGAIELWRVRQYFRMIRGLNYFKVNAWRVKSSAYSHILKQALEVNKIVKNPALSMAMLYDHYFIEGRS